MSNGIAEAAESLLSARRISKSYGGVRAVTEVDVEVGTGEILGLIGPNGAGKTTLFNVISGFVPASGGSLLWKGRDISRQGAAARARLGLVRSFQHARVFKTLSVRQNLALGGYSQAAGPDIDAVARQFGFMGLLDTQAGSLSYGLAKRLGMAIAVRARPEMLLLDEPGAGLNSDEIETLHMDIVAMSRSGITIMLVEHHMKLVMGACSRVVVLDAGRKIAEGTPEEISKDAAVIEAYLGTS